MTTVELINTRFDVVEDTSKQLNISFEEAVNNYLDRILRLRKDLNNMSRMMEELGDLMWNNIKLLSQEETVSINSRLVSLNKVLTKFYIDLRDSPLYSNGLKDSIKEIHFSLSNLKEIQEDLSIYKIDNKSKERFKNLIEEIKTV